MIRWIPTLCVALLMWAACTPANPTSAPSTQTPSIATLPAPSARSPRGSTPESSTPTRVVTACLEQQVLPQLTQAKPQRVARGELIKVMGVGGYLRDSCGGINESARTFPVYLDNLQIGSITCYVNRCEGAFQLADGTSPGSHCLSVEVSQCTIEIQMLGN